MSRWWPDDVQIQNYLTVNSDDTDKDYILNTCKQCQSHIACKNNKVSSKMITDKHRAKKCWAKFLNIDQRSIIWNARWSEW